MLALGTWVVKQHQRRVLALGGELGLLLAVDPKVEVVAFRIAQLHGQIATAEADVDIYTAPIERDRAVVKRRRASHHTGGRIGDRGSFLATASSQGHT